MNSIQAGCSEPFTRGSWLFVSTSRGAGAFWSTLNKDCFPGQFVHEKMIRAPDSLCIIRSGDEKVGRRLMKNDLRERFQINPGKKFRLRDRDPEDTAHVPDKDIGEAIQQKNTHKLINLHD